MADALLEIPPGGTTADWYDEVAPWSPSNTDVGFASMAIESSPCGDSQYSSGAVWSFVNHGIPGGATIHPQDLNLPEEQLVDEGGSFLNDKHSFISNHHTQQTPTLTTAMFHGTNSLGSMGLMTPGEAVNNYIQPLGQEDTDLEREI